MSDANDAVDYIYKHAPMFAKAKSDRAYLEEFRKTKKSLLMMASGESSAVMREAEAYAHPEYQELLAGLRVAIEQEETLKWQLTAAQARIEIYRTESANNRAMDRAAQ
jgi:vacuolar-type H+-ATPase subunit H